MRMRGFQAVQRWVVGLLFISLMGCQQPQPEEVDIAATTGVETAVFTPTTSPTQTPEPPNTPREEATVAPPEPTATQEEPKPEETNELTDVAEEEATAETITEPEEAPTAAEEPETAVVPATHIVAAGETLYEIGQLYNISWIVLAEMNQIDSPDEIEVGQELLLERSNDVPEPTPSPNTDTTYVVQPGENLFRIGLLHGLTWTQIAEANGLVNPNEIEVGQVLKIPISAPGPLPEFVHTVQQNDTLLTIALFYGVPWRTIAEANNLASPYLIFPGQQLTIPSA